MAEYIEREALLKDISESVVFSVKEGQPSLEIRGANKITDRIKAAPAADVVEVVHGEWLDNGDRDSNGVPKPFAISCSICGSSAGASWMKYCPNCGAKMDTERRCEDG